jgi:hypothetical protein
MALISMKSVWRDNKEEQEGKEWELKGIIDGKRNDKGGKKLSPGTDA